MCFVCLKWQYAALLSYLMFDLWSGCAFWMWPFLICITKWSAVFEFHLFSRYKWMIDVFSEMISNTFDNWQLFIFSFQLLIVSGLLKKYNYLCSDSYCCISLAMFLCCTCLFPIKNLRSLSYQSCFLSHCQKSVCWSLT